ncbi:MAG TPA: GAP family protein [Methanobacteriaceae archaeon]|nr:GAP family protein [Methanobacteriaceae archaeon]
MVDVSSLTIMIIPLAWAAAVSPVVLSVFLVMMSMLDDPKLPGFSFYLGAMVILLLTVFVGIFLGHKLNAAGAGDSTTIAAIDIFLGAILVLFGIRNFRETSKSSNLLKYLKVDPQAGNFSKFRKYFILGFIAFLTNFSTVIFLLAAGRTIGIASAGFSADFVAILVLALITLLVIEIPLLFFLLFPKMAKTVTKPVDEWISNHSNIVTGVFCVGIGLLIIYNGLNKMGIM